MDATTMAVLARLEELGDGRDRSHVPFARSYWVVPGKLLAGRNPAHTDEATTRQHYRALADAGIRRVINLMEPHEGALGSDVQVDDQSLMHGFVGEGVRCERFAIQDMGIPDLETLDAALDWIDESLAENEPVYVHCFAGRGRTGTVVGCWLARAGVASGDAVLDVIAALRSDVTSDPNASHRDAISPSPETEDQRAFVRARSVRDSLRD